MDVLIDLFMTGHTKVTEDPARRWVTGIPKAGAAIPEVTREPPTGMPWEANARLFSSVRTGRISPFSHDVPMTFGQLARTALVLGCGTE